jgi:membrane protein YqaA with SNARE-associated domain
LAGVSELSVYAGLFLAALLAATVLPFQSEVVLVGLLVAGDRPWWLLLLVASVGNTLGSVVNWAMGRFLLRFAGRRWFPVKREAMARVEGWYRRYGTWSLLLAWAPFIGDPLTVVAGTLRARLAPFVLMVAAGKTARYAVLVAATRGWW